jgi:phage terminase large subunit-like protein
LAQKTDWTEEDEKGNERHHKGLKLKAYYDLNPPSKRHWSYIRFIDKKDPEPPHRKLINEFDYNYLTMNPHGNAANLDPKYLAQLEALGEAAKKRFLYGQFAEDAEGSLWTEELLAQNRVLGQEGKKLPQWLRVVIAVDPSGTKGPEDKRSDEVGIAVCALGTDGHGYLLEDLSVKAPPEVWGKIAADAYYRHAGDRIVGEVNFGGDMVRAVIQAQTAEDEDNTSGKLPYEEVRASRGKEVRAEPISALYEQGKVHHVGYFPEIEEQLLAMLQSGYVGLRSPDRADAVIWGFTALFPKMVKKDTGPSIPPKINVAPRSARSHTYAQNQNVRVNTATKRRIRRKI